MPYTFALKAASMVACLCIFFLLVPLAGCRDSEPLPAPKAAPKETGHLPTAPPPPMPLGPGKTEAAGVSENLSHPTNDALLPPVPSQEYGEESIVLTQKGRPRIAIIIDDMGYHQQLGRQFLHLNLNLTFSFLPDAPYTKDLAAAAFQAGRDILAHLPMEPKDPSWGILGADALTMQDTPQAIREKTARMMAAIPHAIGANNHMGSRFTENAVAMQVVIETLKNHSYFFIDSYTTAASWGLVAARQQGVPAARRHVFLDNIQEPLKIRQQIVQLITGAKKRGWAIGIGHPNPAMLAALAQDSSEAFHEVEMVGAHRLVQ